MTKSPTAIEFKETVRDAFGYLGREFAFREVEPPTKHVEVNPFLVWFANATTLVQVEGINYGFAAQVIVGPADAFRAKDFNRVVELLLPHVELLTPAERAKLAYARARVSGDGGAV